MARSEGTEETDGTEVDGVALASAAVVGTVAVVSVLAFAVCFVREQLFADIGGISKNRHSAKTEADNLKCRFFDKSPRYDLTFVKGCDIL